MEIEQSDFSEEELINSAPVLNINIPGVKSNNLNSVESTNSNNVSTPTPTISHIPHVQSPSIETSIEQAAMSLQNMYVTEYTPMVCIYIYINIIISYFI